MQTSIKQNSALVAPVTSMIAGLPFILLDDQIELAQRLEICSGTNFVDSEVYVPNAVVPNGDWRRLTPEELEVLTPDGAADDAMESSSIVLWRLPETLMIGLDLPAKAIGKRNRTYIATNVLGLFEFKKAEEKVVEYCRAKDFKNVRLLGSCWTEQNLPTVGIGTHKKRVGLHVDSYVARPLGVRNGFPSRLCINVGPEPRFLLFCNLTVRAMQQMPGMSQNDSPIELVVEFFRRYPTYPILKLQINPGEAYVAPVEIMVHEGTSMGKEFIDAQTTLLGDFEKSKILKLASLEI